MFTLILEANEYYAEFNYNADRKTHIEIFYKNRFTYKAWCSHNSLRKRLATEAAKHGWVEGVTIINIHIVEGAFRSHHCEIEWDKLLSAVGWNVKQSTSIIFGENIENNNYAYNITYLLCRLVA